MTAPVDPGDASDGDRQAAVRERARNLIVDASAGTGKTRLVVERIVELLAPHDDRAAIPIDRLAAITFTRKAAGELRIRTRQRILEALATQPPASLRAARLRDALAGLDTAQLATIHGFADRLLRRWPAQARLDPRYELTDDDDGLTDECFQLLVHAAEAGTLDDLVRGTPAADLAGEATLTILDAQRAGLALRSRDTEHWTYHGLDHLVAGFVRQRDVALLDAVCAEHDRAGFTRFGGEYVGLVDGLPVAARGSRWLVETGEIVRRLLDEPDPAVVFRELVERLERGPRGRASLAPSKRDDFGGDARAWDAWRALDGDGRKHPVRARPLRDDLLAPLRRWLATRLARLGPVVLAVHEQVKARHRVVDHVDLLLRLRDLLRDDRAIRSACQGLYDHIFVDEFQDTDPLQAEIVMLLCERGAQAASWDAVTLAPGRLTLVGDPKQSIYRFRRADIATYQRVIEVVERSPHRAVRLASSFRSAPGLVGWLNHRFADVLGVAPEGERFCGGTGEVFHQPLSPGRASGSDPTVHVVPIDAPPDAKVAELRAGEAAAMARYLRWLVCVSGIEIVDPVSQVRRPIGFGDIGVLAIATSHVPVLLAALDRDDVPHAARGGVLFLADPLHRRFLLGLCALADRDDGVALAALLRPPFFAVDLGDLARARPDHPDDRATQARAIIRELRRRRFERSPGATARALLEDTAIGRAVAVGRNAAQRLGGLRELCFQIEARALAHQLDFDATMERVRGWIERPQALDRPHPVTGDAVRVTTIHQAKGLEFPVVMLWDGRAAWRERHSHDAWRVERDGRGWAIRLDGLTWEEPAGLDLAERERLQREAERRRLVYVAATRARDLLVIPAVGAPDPQWILGTLLGGGRSSTVIERERHAADRHAAWFDAAAPPSVAPASDAAELELASTGAPESDATDLELALTQAWCARAAAAARPRMPPTAFTQAASPRAWWGKLGRFGTGFGETVHLAIGLALDTGQPAAEVVRRAVARTGLAAHRAAAVDDVTRAVAALGALGIAPGAAYRLEYPIAGRAPGGELVAGYVDLVAALPDGLVVLDFKTDRPPTTEDLMPQPYIDQVQGYASVLERALGTAPIRRGLLFTADGAVRWLASVPPARGAGEAT
jgi:ATP-dependent helicase/nuclease subunit A